MPISRFQIHFFVALPLATENDFSPIQGFSLGLLKRNRIIQRIVATFPPTVLELFNPSIKTLQHRYAGVIPYNVQPLVATEFQHLPSELFGPFMVVFTDSETTETVQKWAKEWPYPVWLINMDLPLDDVLTKPNLKSHCDLVMESLRRSNPDHPLLMIGDWRTNRNPDDRLDLSFDAWHHNTTIPNEVTLLSIGFHEGAVKEPLVGKDDVYVSAIVESARAVLKLREAIPSTSLYDVSPPLFSLHLTSPGIFQAVREMERSKDSSLREVSDIVRVMQTQKTYSVMLDGNETKRLAQTLISSPLYALRTDELCTYTSAISVRAASILSPVLRLPPAVDHVMPSVTRLSDCIRGWRPKLSKVRKVAKQLFDDIESRVDPRFIELIDIPHSHIKIISDAPLEWLPIRGLPLMLRKTTSRIPVTPGNLSFQTILPAPPLDLSMRHFSETLVIRSFRADDPIRSYLEDAIEAYRLSNGEKIPVRIVDVRTRADVIKALNAFDGALAIFDCHGSHRKSEDVAVLHLAEESLDVWRLKLEARMPPIVFTCACDTHSVGRTHVTCGNGFLYCGAVAVVASVLPVAAGQASIFAARLLFRIYELLPWITGAKLGRTVRWDGVISLLQRMIFISDMFHAIRTHCNLNPDWGISAETECVSIIHSSGSEWYELAVEALARDSGMTQEAIEEYRTDLLPFPETLKYLHLGNPEMILIGPESVNPEAFRDDER